MLFGSKKRNPSADVVLVPAGPAGREAKERERRQWVDWRLSAQMVNRAWNEWLAADSRQRAGSYHRYLSALAAEERAAAELERMVVAGPTESAVSDCGASAHGAMRP